MNTRQKGMMLSNYVADQIVSKGLDPKCRADGGSGAGNREKADICTSVMIFGQTLGIECKNQKNINHKDSWRQTKKLEKLGFEPVLAFKDFGEPLAETRVVIYLDTFLDLVKTSQHRQTSEKMPTYASEMPYNDQNEQKELKYSLGHLKASVSKVIKLLER